MCFLSADKDKILVRGWIDEGTMGITGWGIGEEEYFAWVIWVFFILFQKSLTGLVCLTTGLKRIRVKGFGLVDQARGWWAILGFMGLVVTVGLVDFY